MKNKKGVIIPAVLVFQIAFGALGLAVLWHIPAWSEAKKNHTEAQYQSRQMWPQQEFSKLPGGDYHPYIAPVSGNGGNFVGGNSN